MCTLTLENARHPHKQNLQGEHPSEADKENTFCNMLEHSNMSGEVPDLRNMFGNMPVQGKANMPGEGNTLEDTRIH